MGVTVDSVAGSPPSRGRGSKPHKRPHSTKGRKSPLRGGTDRNRKIGAGTSEETCRPLRGAWIETLRDRRCRLSVRVVPFAGAIAPRGRPLRGGGVRNILLLTL